MSTNDYLLIVASIIALIAAFIKQGVFNRIFSLFLASIFIILMIYNDVDKIFIAILISLALNFMFVLTCKEYKRS